MPVVPVVVISDFVSPFCWLAEAAMRRLRDEGRVSLEYQAFELFPAPAPPGSPPEVDAALPLAREMGLAISAPSRAPRTRKAHELARMARGYGAEDAVREAMFRAYFAEDRDIGRIDVLVELASASGLDTTEAKVVLDVDKHAPVVEQESARVRAAGIEVAPVLLLGSGERRMRVDGAFSMADWRALIDEIERETRSEG